ncbi:hypothetical protein EB822_07875 [Flavobacteriaceae bacterium PRS1]|nr:hypothetical protein EB822_07875 [Flavobacteriaceae bacterium PRS1]
MKARVLMKRLNTNILRNTKCIVNEEGNYIYIHFELIQDSIRLNKKTHKLQYRLSKWDLWIKSLEIDLNSEIFYELNILQELIDNEKIKDIIEGVDIIENSLPVYSIINGKIVESVTDDYNIPNVTIEGEIMQDHTHFPTPKQAIEYNIKEKKASISLLTRRVNDEEKKLEKLTHMEKEIGLRLNKINNLINKENINIINLHSPSIDNQGN